MTDPERLSEQDGLCSALIGSLQREAPSGASRRRALAAAAAAATAVGAQSSWAAAGGLAALGKWFAGGALLGGLTATGAVAISDSEGSAPAPVRAPAVTAHGPVVPAPPAPATVVAPPAESAAPAAPPRRTAPAAPALPKPISDLREQRQAIDAARRALAAGKSGETLAIVDGYDARTAAPLFGQEASLLRIEALLAQGQAARAQALGRAFLARHPQSPLAQRVRSLTEK
jgi:hypothetical protein